MKNPINNFTDILIFTRSVLDWKRLGPARFLTGLEHRGNKYFDPCERKRWSDEGRKRRGNTAQRGSKGARKERVGNEYKKEKKIQ